MIAVLAESKSDAEAIRSIVARIVPASVGVGRKGYNGKGELQVKAAKQVAAYRTQGYQYFLICRDADVVDPMQVEAVTNDFVSAVFPGGFEADTCVVVAVQELESWLLADEAAIGTVIPSLKLKAFAHPESLVDPKEILLGASRRNSRPLYSCATHNPRVAACMNLDVVARKCPSFKRLVEFCSSLTF